jgi:hypothetical protein
LLVDKGSRSVQIIKYPDPGGPKTYGTYGFGSGSLLESVQIERQDKKRGEEELGK